MSKKKSNKKKKSNISNNLNSKVEQKSSKNSFFKYYLLIGGIIILIFGFIYGFRILNPTYTEWIFASNGDIMQHYVGWEAFRGGDWNFPIGLTDVISYPVDISVIYTDSIPILALFFKIVSFMLPKTFQYLGLYGLLCFVLQGILSARIIRKFTNSKLNVIMVAILFTFIPSMIFRMFYHTALASQWLLLLSLESIFLYNDFKEGKKIYYLWALIAFLVSTIHLYYLLMCGIILIGYIILDVLNTKKIKRSIMLLIIYLSISLLTIWGLGGFTNFGQNDDFGFGLFSYNLNGLFNSQGWSVFLKQLPMRFEQYEGFSYLGLGVIVLTIIAIILTIIGFIKDKGALKKYRNLLISLVFISILSVFVALSPKIYFGDKLLFELKLPSIINNLWGIFRSTGRFVWPVIHIITILSVIVIIKRLNWKYSLLILSICVFIQIIDIGGKLSEIHNFYVQQYVISDENNIYKNDFLKKVVDNNDIELLVFASDNLYDTDLMIFSDWAINNGMRTNKLRFARTSFDDILGKNTVKLLEEKDENKIFMFTSKKECISYELNCYKLPDDYYLGYVNELE